MKGQRVGSFVLAIVLWVALSLLVNACAHAPTPSPVDQVKAYEDAFNRHDLQGVMGLLSDNVTFRWSEMYTAATRADTQALVGEYYFGLNGEFHHTDCTAAADTVTCKAVQIIDWTKAAGLPNGYHYDQAVFTLQGDKISKIAYTMDQAQDNAAINVFANGFWNWLQKTYPADARFTDPSVTGGGQALSKRIYEYATTLK